MTVGATRTSEEKVEDALDTDDANDDTDLSAGADPGQRVRKTPRSCPWLSQRTTVTNTATGFDAGHGSLRSAGECRADQARTAELTEAGCERGTIAE